MPDSDFHNLTYISAFNGISAVICYQNPDDSNNFIECLLVFATKKIKLPTAVLVKNMHLHIDAEILL